MKILLFLFSTLFALSRKDLLQHKNQICRITCSGENDNFTQYAHNILRLEGMKKLKNLKSTELKIQLRSVDPRRLHGF